IKALPKSVKPTDEQAIEAKVSLETSRALSWAFAYHILNKRLDGVYKYFEEVKKLPTEKAPDSDVVRGCFARAFNLLNKDEDGFDQRAMQQVADSWYNQMDNTLLDLERLETPFINMRQRELGIAGKKKEEEKSSEK